MLGNLFDMPVRVSQYVMSRVWVFPKERFVEYEAKDEEWCRRYGFGHEESVPGCYAVGNVLVMHPKFLEALEKELARRREAV